MNTNLLKSFAQQARTKLMSQIAAKLEMVLTTDSGLLREQAAQIEKLNEAIRATSKEQVVDKVAYTWFNRFMALRFMDVNGYQPIGVQVISPKESYTLPELLDEAKQGHIPTELNVDHERINELLNGKIQSNNPQNEVYKMLLIAACNHLNKVFPFLFEHINDYTELLLPDDLTSEFSILQDVRDGMTDEDCQEVEIIGWLYQFYISERKDEVFAAKGRVEKEDIPAATQLFTPRWIVEYMVQNTVGKLWLQNRPNSSLREYMPYYIESPSATNDDYLRINSPEEITLLDQACGSGHILVYGFELLTKIYEEEGYNPTEIPQLIIEKNLYGFEIDERAAQLASMALMMKARSYQRRVFRKSIEPNILCFQDLTLTEEEIKATFHPMEAKLSKTLLSDLLTMQQATNFGSLIIPETSLNELEAALIELSVRNRQSTDVFGKQHLGELEFALYTLTSLNNKYLCIVDNPPYMGGRKMSENLKEWLKINYQYSYQDLYSCFVVRVKHQLVKNGFAALISLQGWMFISSFGNFRKWILSNYNINSLIQIGGNSFPSLNSQVARAVTFSFQNSHKTNWKTTSFNLDDVLNSHNVDKELLFKSYLLRNNYTIRKYEVFKTISTSTFLHSVSNSLLEVFINSKPLNSFANPRQGLATGDNNRFVRYWFELSHKNTFWGNKIKPKWYPYNKGGNYRKWYGNNENVVNWEDDGYEIKNFKDNKGKLRSRPQNEQYYFKKGITYSLIGNSEFCARAYGEGFIFDVGGSGFFPQEKEYHYFLGLVNSHVGSILLSKLNPTVNFQVGDISSIPIPNFMGIKHEVDKTVKENIDISKDEWTRYEQNIEYCNDELLLLKNQNNIIESTKTAKIYRLNSLQCLFNNENKLDEVFRLLYNIELSEISNLKKIALYGTNRFSKLPTLKKVEKSWTFDVISNFVSYAVGCMFGRYSLDKEGLILANQGETLEDYIAKVGVTEEELQFVPDEDNIIPILDDEWFKDDMVGLFNAFLKRSFGKENFEQNLAFVEESLGRDMRNYFLRDFYTDHVRRYKKRPIYWLFSSPKGSFNVLIYMHRYTPDTLNRIFNNYLAEYREKLKMHSEQLNHIIEKGSGSEQTQAAKELDKIKTILLELQEYERDILYPLATERIPIDLDDGVLVNYNKFGSAIKQVAGLNDKKTKKKVKGFDWIDGSTIR